MSDSSALQRPLGILGVLRLGLVQTALGAIVVLTTSTINRVMAVELALPALLPGLLVGLHYAVQMTRPRLGYGSDCGGRRTPWIIGGMAVLAAGGALAAVATAVTSTHAVAGIALAFAAFTLVGVGVGCAGTSLLVLLAKSVTPRYRGAAATTVWVMMIVGFIVTTIVAGKQLDPFSFERLVAVTSTVSIIAFVVACLAVWGVEKRHAGATPAAGVGVPDDRPAVPFREALADVWAEAESRRFAIFVFVSMLAYSAQDLILEPFAGAVFMMTPGESTQLSGTQHGGVLTGMLLVALCCSVFSGRLIGSLRFWTLGGCIASALVLSSLAAGGLLGERFPLVPAVFCLGVANGAFAVGAIGSMMDLVGRGANQREGLRMGLWGAAQAIAFGVAGLLATLAVDAARLVLGDAALAYALVFFLQAAVFLFAARLARRVYAPAQPEERGTFSVGRLAMGTE